MSREIKFRAWQKTASLHRKPGMYKVESMELYDGYGGGEAFLAKVDEGSAKSSEFFQDIELMQYTGLKDKNGVEIYEGDVVRWNNREPFEVYWRDEFGGFYLKRDDSTGDWIELIAPGFGNTTSCEVIGNIYENPELLESK